MPALALFAFFALAWAIFAVRWARRRFSPDPAALTFGLVAGLGVSAALLLMGISVGGAPTLMWTVLPVALVVVVSTVLAERRRATVTANQRARRATGSE